jgi:NitT/TauT family transport system substrate-binding protein
MRNLIRQAFIVAILAAAVLSRVTSSAAADTLRVGKADPAAFSFVPLEVGMQTGIFKKYGLDIESIGFAGSSKLQLGLASGAIDIALGGGPDLAFLVKGSPAKAVAALAGPPLLFVLVARNDGSVNGVKDLKGKTVGVSTTGSTTSWLVSTLSKGQGWGPDGIHQSMLGATPSIIAALETKNVDAAITDITTALKLQNSGQAKIIYHFGDLLHDFQLHVIYASDSIIAQKPDDVKAFLKGWFETIAYMRTHKAQTVDIAAGVLQQDKTIVAQTYDALMPMFSNDGKFNQKGLELLRTSWVDLQVLPAPPDLSKVINDAYLPR